MRAADLSVGQAVVVREGKYDASVLAMVLDPDLVYANHGGSWRYSRLQWVTPGTARHRAHHVRREPKRTGRLLCAVAWPPLVPWGRYLRDSEVREDTDGQAGDAGWMPWALRPQAVRSNLAEWHAEQAAERERHIEWGLQRAVQAEAAALRSEAKRIGYQVAHEAERRRASDRREVVRGEMLPVLDALGVEYTYYDHDATLRLSHDQLRELLNKTAELLGLEGPMEVHRQ